MRKSTKIILGIAGSLIVVGGICWILVLALIHGDWQRLSVYDPDESTQRQTYSIPAEQVHSLQIQAVDHTVRILVADTDQVQISYMERQDETYSIDLDDQGNLTIHYQQDRHWIQNWFQLPGWDRQDTDLVLTVPNFLAGGAKIQTVSGNLYLEGLSIQGPLEVETTSGDVLLTNIHIHDKFDFSSISGDLQGIHCWINQNGSDLKTTSGDIALSDCQIQGSLQSSTVSGEADLQRVSVSGDLSLSSTSGDMDLENVSAQNYSFATTSGDIDGLLGGDETMYTVVSSTSNGDLRLPVGRAQGPLTLRVKTTSGDVNLAMEPITRKNISPMEY